MRALASARAQGTSTQCTSSQAAPKAARAPRLAFKKQLTANAAALLALGAPAAQAGELWSDAPAAISLPDVQVPDISLPSVSLPDVDVSGLLDSADPLLIGGVAAAVVVPGLLIALLGGNSGSGNKVKGVTAAKALEALAADEYCILLDIRSKAEIKESGSPNLKGVSRRGAVSVPYTSIVKDEVVIDDKFGSKVAKVKGVEAGGAPVILLDTSGKEVAAAAKAILEEVELERIYYVQGGADAWQASGGPWKEPSAGFSFSLPDLSALDLSSASKTIAGGVQTLASDLENAPPSAKGLLTAGAVVGASALLFSQVELLLEVAGLLAAGQFLLKVLFAEDRQRTLTEIKTLAQQVDIKDLPVDLGKIATTLLEDPTATPSAEAGKAEAKKAEVAAPAPEKQPAPAPAAVPVVAASNGGEPASSPAAPKIEA